MENIGREEVCIDEDILISILSHLPLLDLISACQVSKSWNRAVFFSLHRRKTMPWFILYKQKSFPPYTMSATAKAYDPNSDKWIELITEFPMEHVSVARSSHSTLLYALSPAKLSFSIDSFHLDWRHVAPPRLYRLDPIVAVVGRSLIVAGGVNEYDDEGDRLAVEVLDMESDGVWERCESMPDLGSASSTWLSVAASSEKMYVTEKTSGLTCCFDPKTRTWTELPQLCPVSEHVYSRVIGFGCNRLLMAGITGDEYNPVKIEIWEVVTINESEVRFEWIGSMPKTCLEKLRGTGSDWPLTSITLNVVGDHMVYIHDATVVGGDIVAAEMEGGKLCKWRSMGNADATTCHAGQRVFGACSNVTFTDLKRAFRDHMSFSMYNCQFPCQLF